MSGRFHARASVTHVSPAYDPHQKLAKFETLGMTRERNVHLARTLLRRGKARDADLARRLNDCGSLTRGQRSWCNSPACAICMRETRRWFTSTVSELIEKRALMPPHGVMVTVVPPQFRASLGKLSKLDISALRRRFWRSIDKLQLGNVPVIGGLDISFNESAILKEPGHYQVHLAFVVPGLRFAPKRFRKALSRKIAAAFDVEGIPRAVVVQPLRDLVPQVSYLLKSMFSRRVSIVGRRGRADTKSHSLKTCQLIEIAHWLDAGSLTDRMLLHGIRRQNYTLISRHQHRRCTRTK